jgi:hypothetical protein
MNEQAFHDVASMSQVRPSHAAGVVGVGEAAL